MNRVIKIASAFLLTALPVSAAILSTSFESSMDSWSVYTNTTNGAASTNSLDTTGGAEDGSKFCRIKVTAIDTNYNWLVQLQDPSWTAEANVEYHYSFYIRASGTKTIQVSAGGGEASGYKWYTGTEFVVTTSWKKIDYYYTSGVTGKDSLNFNIYCAYDTGTYDIDNIVLEESINTYPSTMSVATQSAWESGVHRNLFKELGYTQAQIDEKVNNAFQQLFFGDHDLEAVYTEVGTDLGYINKPGSGSIITEGQSYGMMIAVQMDRQDIFNRLWNFAYTYMLHHDGYRKGMFSWKVYETSPYTMVDPNPAPDGEEYFVTSLLFAAQRWGNGDSLYNYQAQADSILTEMLHKAANDTVVAEIDSAHAMILFSPDARSDTFYTDPSYHLPAFYTVWSQLATNDKDYWAKMADTSRAFFQRACHDTTGLTSDYAYFDGTPVSGLSWNRFSGWYHSDAWRVPMNIGMDYSWYKADDWQIEYSKRILSWLASQSGDYKQTYSIDGTPQSESSDTIKYYSASAAQIACNAVAALASNDTIGWQYVNRLWKLPVTTGTWRYYHGLLTMMGLLHCSGKFVIWGNPSLVGVNDSHLSNVHSVTKYVSGTAEILNLSGRVVAKVDLGKGVSLANLTSTRISDLTELNSSNGVYFIKARGTNNKVYVKRISSVK